MTFQICTSKFAGIRQNIRLLSIPSKNWSTFTDPENKYSGMTLKPDPTLISGLWKFRCPWDKLVERQCNGVSPEDTSLEVKKWEVMMDDQD
ncbi:hypothetical protein TNCV_3187501 [Trichonephila clavipes]|nr:hypothetical protein TNCV_3187501 [Trichonephila clavipes]